MPKSKSNLKIKPGSISEGDDAMELASGEDSGDLTAEDEKKDKDILGEIKNFLSNLQTISLTDKIFFVQNLRVMVKSGLSLSLAIETIASQLTNSRFKKILTEISDRVQAGVSFAATLEKYPKVFNELFRNMVKSGELSGNLEEVLEKLHIQMKKDHDLVAKVKGAMIYPAVVLMAMVGIGAAMMIFVVPKLITVFDEFQANLPLPTKILINISKFITDNGLPAGLGLLIFIIAFVKFARSHLGKKVLHKVFLFVPIFGKITRKINLARFCRTASSLLKTDIPIIKTFEITSMVVGNVYYKQALRQASEKIAKGTQINAVLAKYPQLFPATVIQMVKVGEESGAINSVLDEVAQFYEDDIDQVMQNLPAVIEPVLILFLGLGVGAMAVAIIMPMYSLGQAI